MIAKLMGLRTIAPRDLQSLEGQNVTVFDVNAPASWMRARVPGARNLDPAAFTAADLPAERDAAIVFYCSNPWCRKAPNAARRASALGFTNVRVMSAGIQGWIDARLPVEKS